MYKQLISPGFPIHLRNANMQSGQGSDSNALFLNDSGQHKYKPSRIMAYLTILLFIAFSNTSYAQIGWLTCTNQPTLTMSGSSQTICPKTTVNIVVNVNTSNPGGWTNFNIVSEVIQWRYVGAPTWTSVGRNFSIYYDGVTPFEIHGLIKWTADCIKGTGTGFASMGSDGLQFLYPSPTVNLDAPAPGCAGGNVTLTGTAANYDNLKWERSTDGGTTWADIAGATGLTYTVSNAPATANGYQYRLKAYKTNPCNNGEVKSEARTLVVSAPLTAPVASVTTQTSCTGGKGTITVTSPAPATGITYSVDGINYQASSTFTGLAPGTYSVTVKNAGGCVSTPLSLTVNPVTPCPAAVDLTPIITLPATTFVPNQAKDFIVKLTEILGGTTSGTIAFSVTVPTGYKITMNPTATSVTVTGAGTPVGSPIPVSNANWTVTSNGDGLIDVIAKPGMNITGNSFTNIGFHLERLSTTGPSVGNIAVNIYPDLTLAYDTNNGNNLYSRTITGTK